MAPAAGVEPPPLIRAALRLRRAALPLVLLGLAALAAGLALRSGTGSDTGATLALYAGGGLLLAGGALRLLAWLHHRQQRRTRQLLALLCEPDEAACFVTDAAGRSLSLNAAARRLLAEAAGPAAAAALATGTEALGAALAGSFAAPGPAVARLQATARAQGTAREEVVLRRGHSRISVRRLGPDSYLWRLESRASGREAEPGAATLALPMLSATAAGRVLFVNRALRELLGNGADPGGALRRDRANGAVNGPDRAAPERLEQIFAELPLRPGRIHRLLAPGAPRVRLAEFAAPTGRREVYLLPLAGEDDAAGWSLADDFPVPLLKLTAEGRILTANARACELLGPAAVEGRALADLVEGLGRSITDWLGEAAQGGGLRQPEVVRALRDDREVFLQIRLGRLEPAAAPPPPPPPAAAPGQGSGADPAPAPDLAPAPGPAPLQSPAPRLIAVLSDLTELKTLEAQFVQSQKMQAIGQLAGGIAHDFNNLLTAITGHCDLLLLRHADAADPDHADLQQVAQNANRAAALVGQLLAFSRKQNLQPQALDLREVLADLAHLLNRLVSERVTLVLEPTQGLLPVRADRRQFEQVMMNLVVNARDAMPAGGEIHVSAATATLAAPFQRDRATVPQGDWVVVRVRDQGTGIPPDRIEKLFEPFFTTKRPGEGTGLGLSTAYGIVKQSGGFIFVDTALGVGSEFQVWLPVFRGRLAAAPPPAVAGPPRPPAPAGDRGVVLLVEDEAPVRAFASRALRLRGHAVLEATSGEEALALLQDDGLRVGVFVTDVVMPGLDGPSWVAQALKRRPQARVVFVSGYAEDSVAEHQARIPGSVFLQKPFSLTQLIATVDAQLA